MELARTGALLAHLPSSHGGVPGHRARVPDGDTVPLELTKTP